MALPVLSIEVFLHLPEDLPFAARHSRMLYNRNAHRQEIPMAIKAGDKIPSVTLKQLSSNGLQDLATDSVFGGKKVVMFAVPGAFTPTCSAKHLPGFVGNLDKFKALGVEVACLAVNDPFVMKAWSEAGNADGIFMLADGNGTFTKALGLEMDSSGYGLGTRCQRFALYAENGVVKSIAVEKPGAFEVSGAEAMLKAVGGEKHNETEI
jgi:peroxiredoxin